MRSQLLYSYGFTHEYLEAVERASGLRPRDRFVSRALADAQYAIGEEKMQDGYFLEAFEYHRDALANDPENVMALTAAASVALHQGDLLGAQRTLELTPERAKDAFQVLVNTGQLALRRSRYDAARAAFEQAAEGGQESPTMHVGLGFLSLKEGDRDSGMTHFNRALEIATSRMDAAYDIVDVCSTHGFAGDARPYAERLVALATAAIAADPGEPFLYGYRALGYSALGHEDRAARDRASKRSLLGWWEDAAPYETAPPVF
jgi:Tfp pilus assembly protein PilF